MKVSFIIHAIAGLMCVIGGIAALITGVDVLISRTGATPAYFDPGMFSISLGVFVIGMVVSVVNVAAMVLFSK